MDRMYMKQANYRDFLSNTVKLFLLFYLSLGFGLVNAEDHAHEHPHHLSVLIGGTHVLDHDVNGETIGLDYEYRTSDLLGFGFVAEHAFEDVDATTLIAVADIHTPIGLIAQIGPGIEFTDHGDRFLFRIGGLYEFEFESFTVSPQFHIDIAENADDSLVFGFAFGKHF